MVERSRLRPAPERVAQAPVPALPKDTRKREDSMSGKFLIPLLATAFLAVPAFAPTAGLSGSALAVTNLNTSRSNIARTKTPKTVGATTARATVNRRPTLTPYRRPILTPLSDGFWR
jgi:hypothetical protein